MSIAALQEASKELRRLAIAGSALAREDFRIRKLIPVLQKGGEKVPVFAKVAGSLEELVTATENDSPRALLQATILVNAVLYTQVQHKVEGEFGPVENVGVALHSRPIAAKTLRAVVEALSTTGPGRMEVVENAIKDGLFNDVRLLKSAVDGVADLHADLADLVAREVLPRYGRSVLPILRAQYDPKGGAADIRRLTALARILTPEEVDALLREVYDAGQKEMRLHVASLMDSRIGNARPVESIVRDMLRDKSMEVRQVGYRIMYKMEYPDYLKALLASITKGDSEIICGVLGRDPKAETVAALVEVAKAELDSMIEKKKAQSVNPLLNIMAYVSRQGRDAGFEFLEYVFKRRAEVAEVTAAKKGESAGKAILQRLRVELTYLKTSSAKTLLQQLEME